MMISRKRRKSPIPTSSDVPSKRARILSNLWQREEDITVDRVIKTSRHQHTGKTPVFDQGADEIVIDREDDRFTRRKYGPDRVSDLFNLGYVLCCKEYIRQLISFKCDVNVDDKSTNES